MFTKILIANRGEIACRVIKTARQMGILTVAVYSDADANSLHVSMADEAIYLGPSPSRESYLLSEKVIAAALKTGAQAIHPGYGFLSENSDFCKMCSANNIIFIGPPVAAIEAMGSKSAAKSIMEKANVPLVPGYHGDNQSRDIIKEAADKMGYPVLLKATAGGGGKGMRQVWSEAEFDEALAGAKRESLSSFGDDSMLVEKYLTQPRHVEIQVFCDNFGNCVYLFERDCSVQRRHQKVIEEAPAPGMTEELRQKMGEAAIKSAQAIGYQGAGTVEFLLDIDGSFYFMEMNTRLQVEHPVTEMITGQDLVEWQLRVASGEPLPLQQDQLKIHGHAFEARIYAEDPNNDFLPATGILNYLLPPEEDEHVRVDTGVCQGDEVSVFYDPMIAKLIVWGENRDKALQRLAKALIEYRIKGVTTNIDFLYNLATAKPFKEADLDTGFIEKHHRLIFKDNELNENSHRLNENLPLAALYILLKQAQHAKYQANKSNDPNSPWHITNAWRANEGNTHRFEISEQNTVYPIRIEQSQKNNETHYLINVNSINYHCRGNVTDNTLSAIVNGHRMSATVAENLNEYSLFKQDGVFHFNKVTADCGQSIDDELDNGLSAPMNGTLIDVLVKENQLVEQGQPLLIMEAMKMEHTIRAPSDGRVDQFFYNVGELVDGGSLLLSFVEETK